jgi:hypothetical protein
LERREIGMGKEAWALLMYNGGRRSGSGTLGAINTGANGHTVMHDETRPCVAWESYDAINVALPKVGDGVLGFQPADVSGPCLLASLFVMSGMPGASPVAGTGSGRRTPYWSAPDKKKTLSHAAGNIF